MTEAAEIGASGIGKSFGRFTALKDITLTIGRGEFLTLLGPSGSGKTTFLMVLSGFEPASAGRLTLNGRDITETPPEARGFGMVFQGYALFPHLTVEENIAFPLKVQGRSAKDIAARVKEMVEMVGLGGHGHKKPASLSGGQQQRVALARALAYAPPVLLLDEPFSALDKNLRGQMQEEMRRIHQDTGTTFVFVTHDQEEALALSSRIAIFERGQLQQIAPPREIYERPANRFVAEFLGDINILPLEAGGFEGRSLRLPPGQGSNLAIRPEYMELSLAQPAEGNAIPLRLSDLTYLGATTRLALTTAGGVPVVLQRPTASLPEGLNPGAELWTSWEAGRGFLL
ncbi:ABC transporter ATP-binding protein [Pseudogemmobacter sp. CC-YST710]|uniref:ABC transporter ATP-binding protein n=1 Tax=Pseudogemmobacter faecipullorum TaxID=2755041 RepID=A0ABS8CNN5_9RHOB|nr:ABC transporter ATP-binding protein [Pseudogemmobacter faecipullorum]MCB5410982.1 ABC transporter ATP-binding protein [Pseudogemmobacter faecipullorum]